MIKWLGSGLLILTGVLAGYEAGEELERRISRLELLRKLVLLLRQEIRYRQSELAEAFRETGRKLPSPYGQVLLDLAEELGKGEGKGLWPLWQEGWQEGLKGSWLSAEDREQFLLLGGSLGYPDLQMQEGALALYTEQLERTLSELRLELPARRRVCRCLGTAAGLLLTVLLI